MVGSVGFSAELSSTSRWATQLCCNVLRGHSYEVLSGWEGWEWSLWS